MGRVQVFLCDFTIPNASAKPRTALEIQIRSILLPARTNQFLYFLYIKRKRSEQAVLTKEL